jgi:hypothetical protein
MIDADEEVSGAGEPDMPRPRFSKTMRSVERCDPLSVGPPPVALIPEVAEDGSQLLREHLRLIEVRRVVAADDTGLNANNAFKVSQNGGRELETVPAPQQRDGRLQRSCLAGNSRVMIAPPLVPKTTACSRPRLVIRATASSA